VNQLECEKIKWQPKEMIDLGDGCRIGIATRNGCYKVFVVDHNGNWEPTNWIPAKAAKRLGELATAQISLAS